MVWIQSQGFPDPGPVVLDSRSQLSSDASLKFTTCCGAVSTRGKARNISRCITMSQVLDADHSRLLW